MDDDLSKSRRNLIVISVLLLVFDMASISIAKVSVLGTELVVGNPRILPTLLWSIWAYMVLRYLQLLGALQQLGLREKFNERMNRHLRAKLEDLALKASPSDWTPWDGTVTFETLSRSGLRWHQDLTKYEKTNVSKVVGQLMVPTSTMLFAIFRSATFVIFATPRVTEHVFPLALAAAALAVALFK